MLSCRCASYSFCFIVLWTDFIYLWQTAGGGAAAAMVASDMDEGAGEGWGEDAALVIDEGIYFF